MGQIITSAAALKAAGITKPTLLKWEKEWRERFNRELPIPENHLGYRQFNGAWVAWLREAKRLRGMGWSWLDIKLEMQPPAREKLRAKPPAPGFAGEL